MATLAFLRSVVDEGGRATGQFECSVCGERFNHDQKLLGAVDTAFVQPRLQKHPILPSIDPSTLPIGDWPAINGEYDNRHA